MPVMGQDDEGASGPFWFLRRGGGARRLRQKHVTTFAREAFFHAVSDRGGVWR